MPFVNYQRSLSSNPSLLLQSRVVYCSTSIVRIQSTKTGERLLTLKKCCLLSKKMNQKFKIMCTNSHLSASWTCGNSPQCLCIFSITIFLDAKSYPVIGIFLDAKTWLSRYYAMYEILCQVLIIQRAIPIETKTNELLPDHSLCH